MSLENQKETAEKAAEKNDSEKTYRKPPERQLKKIKHKIQKKTAGKAVEKDKLQDTKKLPERQLKKMI